MIQLWIGSYGCHNLSMIPNNNVDKHDNINAKLMDIESIVHQHDTNFIDDMHTSNDLSLSSCVNNV